VSFKAKGRLLLAGAPAPTNLVEMLDEHSEQVRNLRAYPAKSLSTNVRISETLRRPEIHKSRTSLTQVAARLGYP